jgi:GNAT superfamily N-acetyltransferase
MSLHHPGIDIHPFQPGRHSLHDITDLLHRSYRRLLDMGLHFTATAQTPDVTYRRLITGQALLAFHGGRLVGTITYYNHAGNSGCPWYARPEVGRFGQFAIDPDCQGRGWGGHLMASVEHMATSEGKTELALDTSEEAAHLINYYAKRGFRFVEHLQWPGLNYRSVVLSKTLSAPPR